MTSEIQVVLKTPNWLKAVGLIIIGIVIIALIRGCNNSKVTLAENNQLKESNKRLSKQINQDSINRKESEEKYVYSDSIQSGIIEIQQNKLDAANDTLDKANKRINKLLAKYKPISPSVDTNITTVPNEYIEECSQCFTELEAQQQREKVVKAKMDNLQQSLNSKINTQQLRIDQLGKEQVQSNKNLNNSRAINEAYQKKLELRGRLFLSMGIMAIRTPFFPNAAGIGISYQDKRFRMVSARFYTSEYGSVKALDIHMPLSFK